MVRNQTTKNRIPAKLFARRTKEGTHIPQTPRAQKAVDYGSEEHWGLKRKQHEETENETTKETEETEQHKRRNVDKCNNTENE